MLVCGIDEAGRGPLIGPMVMAGVLVDEEGGESLKSLGVKDSKLLSQKRRVALYKRIVSVVKKYKIVVIEPKEIDAALKSDDLNLNWLEAHTSAKIINELKPDKAIIDSPSNNVVKYKRYLMKLLDNKKIDAVVEHKADVNHVECSAASILAKVTREEEIERIKKDVGDFGSLPYDEEVLIENDNQLRLEKIGKLVELKPKNVKVFSLDPKTYKIKKYRTTRFIVHPATRVYELALERGKSVKLSSNHPVFVLNKKCELEPVAVSRLKEGDQIAVAGQIVTRGNCNSVDLLKYLKTDKKSRRPVYVEGKLVRRILKGTPFSKILSIALKLGYMRTSAYNWRKYMPLNVALDLIGKEEINDPSGTYIFSYHNREVRLPVRLNITEELMWVLGMYISEGYSGEYTINIASRNKIFLKRIKKWATKLNIGCFYARDGINLSSVLLIRIFEALNLGKIAYNKRIPDFAFSCSKNKISALLKGIYDGDGYFADGNLEIETYSKELAKQLQWLQLILKNVTSFYKRGNRPGMIVRVLSKNTNSLSPDNIPSTIRLHIRQVMSKKRITVKELARRTAIDVAQLRRIINTKRIFSNLERRTLKKINSILKDNNLARIIDSDICWFKVVEKRMAGKEKVYDLEVKPQGKKIENFIGGRVGILLHNSGYLTDPKTVRFFEENFEKRPEIFRKTWAPYRKRLHLKGQRTMDDF